MYNWRNYKDWKNETLVVAMSNWRNYKNIEKRNIIGYYG